MQDEEIARAHGYKQQAPASPSHAGQRRQPDHDAQLAAALKQSTLESSNSNYSGGSRARSNGPSYYHTFPNGAESSLPPSQQALYPSSSQPYPQAASGYAPGGPSHMSQVNRNHPPHDNPEQKFEEDLQLALAMSASEAKIEQQRQDIFQSKQLQAMQQYRDQRARSQQQQQPQAPGQRPPWQQRISDRLKSFPSGHAPSAPPLASSNPSGTSSASQSSGNPFFPSLTGKSLLPHTAPPCSMSTTQHAGAAEGNAARWQEHHGPEDPFDLLIQRDQAGNAPSNGHVGYSAVGTPPAANGHGGAQGQQHGSSSHHGLQSSPSLMDDWPVSPPAQTPTNQNGKLHAALTLLLCVALW